MLTEHVLLQLDARKEGVEVPDHLDNNPALTLKLSYQFQGQTTADESGITAYLRFSGNYHKCVIPWDAVWGMTSSAGDNQVWTEDLPREVVMQFARQKISELGRKLFGKENPSAPTAESPVSGLAKEEPATKAPAEKPQQPQAAPQLQTARYTEEPGPTTPEHKPPKKPNLTRIKNPSLFLRPLRLKK